VNDKQITGVSLESLLATPEWHSLGANLGRLLTVALHTRNLPAVIQEMYPSLDDELRRRIVGGILRETAVRYVVDLYALGIATPQSEVTSGKAPIGPSADVPVTNDDGLADAVQVN